MRAPVPPRPMRQGTETMGRSHRATGREARSAQLSVSRMVGRSGRPHRHQRSRQLSVSMSGSGVRNRVTRPASSRRASTESSRPQVPAAATGPIFSAPQRTVASTSGLRARRPPGLAQRHSRSRPKGSGTGRGTTWLGLSSALDHTCSWMARRPEPHRAAKRSRSTTRSLPET